MTDNKQIIVKRKYKVNGVYTCITPCPFHLKLFEEPVMIGSGLCYCCIYHQKNSINTDKTIECSYPYREERKGKEDD